MLSCGLLAVRTGAINKGVGSCRRAWSTIDGIRLGRGGRWGACGGLLAGGRYELGEAAFPVGDGVSGAGY